MVDCKTKSSLSKMQGESFISKENLMQKEPNRANMWDKRYFTYWHSCGVASEKSLNSIFNCFLFVHPLIH